MNIVMIGTGNVAVVLSKKLKAAGHVLLQVYGRNEQAAAALALESGAQICHDINTITLLADVYIMAVSDTALINNAIPLKLHDQLLVHTAGAVTKEVLSGMSDTYGVLYPFQSIRKEADLLPAIPFLVDANTAAARQRLLELADSIAQNVIVADDAARLHYHLCGVITNNFSNYLYVLVERYCRKHQLSFNIMLPMITETAARLHRFLPAQVQTGPAIRQDFATIERHQDLLGQEPELSEIYNLFSKQMLRHQW